MFITKIKLFIIKLFHISTYLDEYKNYQELYLNIKDNYEIALDLIDSYKKELDEANNKIEKLSKLCEEPLAQIDKEVNAVIEKYSSCAEAYEKLIEKQENLRHKAYATGRKDAYAEMGIRALNARLAGNTLYMDENGDVVEHINPKSLEEICEEEEIEIDDLIDVLVE